MRLFPLFLFVAMLAIILMLVLLVARRAFGKYRETGSLIQPMAPSFRDGMNGWAGALAVWPLAAGGGWCIYKGLAWLGLLLLVVGGVIAAANIVRGAKRPTNAGRR
jgi:hypothetical protein